MMRRLALGLVLLGPFVLPLAPIDAQAPSPAGAAATPRAIRRDLPITNSIRRAYDAGTRDMTGRPGPNYWQLQTDYDHPRPARSRHADDDRHRNDRGPQQQPAGPERAWCCGSITTSSAAWCRAACRCRPRTLTAWSSRGSSSTATPSI